MLSRLTGASPILQGYVLTQNDFIGLNHRSEGIGLVIYSQKIIVDNVYIPEPFNCVAAIINQIGPTDERRNETRQNNLIKQEEF